MIRFLLILCFVNRLSLNSSAQKIDSLLEVQRQADPQEKVYVHFDKRFYNPGETIWFKAYVFAGIDPSDVSKNLYAELLDEQGNVLNQRTAPIIFSGATGNFDIDSNTTRPLVFFRAYTISILNSDTSFLYTKAIPILTIKTPQPKATSTASVPTLKFLPEGGNLVGGLTSNVAFAVNDQQQLPVSITGVLQDKAGKKVADLQTLHNGMGQFSFVPEQGNSYVATWKDGKGKQFTTPLPPAMPRGITLRITDESNGKRFTIARSADATEEMKQLHVYGYINQQVAFKSAINMQSRQSASGIFPTGELPTGILQITVFDNQHRPLAERITFINNRNFELDGDAYFLQKNFTKRGLNQLEVAISDSFPSNLSLSITDADVNIPNDMEDNIVSRFLVTGDLRGKVTNPYYYFFSNSDSVSQHLDLVMLTHGWRRYNWENVLAGKKPIARWKESNYLSLDGKLAGLLQGSISPDLSLNGILQTSDSAKNFISLPVDRTGKVFTDGLIFYDNAKLYFNFNKKNLSFDKTMLLLDNGLRKGFKKAMPDTIAKLGLPNLPTATVLANQRLTKMSLEASRLMAKSNVLDNITVRARAKTAAEKMEEKYVSGLFSGNGRSFDLVNDPLATNSMDIFQYLQGKVAGLQIGSGPTPSLSWRGGSPVVYLNEMPADVSLLSTVPVSDIAYVKVFRPGETIVSGGGNGVIAIYTRKGGDAQPDPNAKGLSFVPLVGYSVVKEFYSPDYATFSERHAYDDVRSTLYWNPAIFLDKNRKRLRVKFYNNDVTKRFRIVLEGFNTMGQLIHVEKEVGQ